jgi:peptidyl-prolyl cis-trans isomerase SurA
MMFSTRSFFPLFLLLTCLALNVFSVPDANAAVRDVDRIVAIVDDDVVLRSELDSELKQIVAQLRRQNTQPPPKEVLERQVLERLILKKLQLAAAERAGISVGEDILAQAMGNIAKKNGLTLSQFRSAVEAQGMSFQSFRENIRETIQIQRYLARATADRVHITDREIATYVGQQTQTDRPKRRSAYHILHILVATGEGASSDELRAAKKKAGKLVAKLRGGADFKQVAVAESDGRNALEGGDIGWRKANQLPTLFAGLAPKMSRGEISDPIRSASGYHIIKLVDYRGGASRQRIITQIRARHILVKTSEVTSDNDARQRLGQLKQRLEGGDDFAELARSHSDDQSSALKGGDLGWISAGDVVPEFEEQIKRLQAGQMSEPFRTPFGWHLVQVLERRQHDSTQDVKEAEAREAIRKRKAGEEIELLLRRLRDEAYVEIRLEDI